MRSSSGRGVLAVAMLAALTFGVSGCGATTSAARPAAAVPDLPPAVPVTAQVDGRMLVGHCRGRQRDEPPVLLEAGPGAGVQEVALLEERLATRTLVCAYDRAGIGASDPVAGSGARPLGDLVSDLDAFVAATGARAPYVLAGRSLGGTIAFRYAQAHPGRVAGFVSLDPVPPMSAYLTRVRATGTAQEYADERAFYRGGNPEKVDLSSTDKQRRDEFPASVRYRVLLDPDCDGDTDRCARVLPAIALTTRELATRGPGGTFVAAPGAARTLATRPDAMAGSIEAILTGD